MKLQFLPLAILIFFVPIHATAQWGKQIYVTTASVSGPIIGGVTAPSATLSVSINTSPGPTTATPIVLSTNVGTTCPDGAILPYNHGCYMAPGATSMAIGLSTWAVSQPTWITVNVQVEYDDTGKDVPVLVLPTTTPPICETCSCDSCSAGRPIDLSTGNTWINQTDISRLPGIGNGLALVRTWNSRFPSDLGPGIFGSGWRSNYEERVFVGSDGTVKYSRGDGSFISFSYSNSAWIAVSPSNVNATLTTGTSNWSIRLPDGEQRLFDNASGSLVSIIDRNGNPTTLAYDSANRLSVITDPSGRHLTFSYLDPSSRLVVGATTDVGHSVSYTYDAEGRLALVTETDSSKLSFEYDDHSFIAAVKDSTGKILESHTYDTAGRGLSSSRANGVEALTVTYPVSQ